MRRSGRAVDLVPYRESAAFAPPSGPLLLRLSDPVMLRAAQALARDSIPFLGPRAEVLARCYDKFEAYRLALANGVDCPATFLAGEPAVPPRPLVLKPRRGSDSIGVRVIRRGPIPAVRRNDRHIVQELVRGIELTVGILHGRAGTPLQIMLPPGTPYSFGRKYLLRTPRAPLADPLEAQRVRETALRIAEIFGVNWAARVDLMLETATGRLRFLECDVAPLVSMESAFAASLEAGGLARADQLRLLLNEGLASRRAP